MNAVPGPGEGNPPGKATGTVTVVVTNLAGYTFRVRAAVSNGKERTTAASVAGAAQTLGV